MIKKYTVRTMSNRVVSFTEYALLNRWALDCLSPSDFQKRRIASTGESVLEILKDAKVNPYSNLKNSSCLYYASKFFITTPLKIAYIAVVTFTLSRLGIVMNGFFTVYSYCRYKITAYQKTNEVWEKTKGYAFAFFADLSSAAVGAFLTKIVVESTFYTLHFCRIGSWMGVCELSVNMTAPYLIISVAAAVLGCAGLIALQSPSVAPQFFAMPQDRVGMYLSMILRKGLGIVSEKGGLLPFSANDQLQYSKDSSYYRFEGANYDTLITLIFNAEWEVLETVQKCNQYLPNKIPYQYPFNGEAVAHMIEGKSETLFSKSPGNNVMIEAGTASLYLLSAQLKGLAKKIKVLKEIFKTSQKLTVNDSIPVWLIKAALRVRWSAIQFNESSSFINERAYKDYYKLKPGVPGNNSPPGPQSSAQKASQKIKWETYNITAIEPNSASRPTGIVDKFRYDIGVSKWNIEKDRSVMPLRAFFDLEEGCSYSDYKKQRHVYWLKIHPDKNSSQDAAELFKGLSEIVEELEREYNKS
jgi:hypothetical protein